MKRCEAPSPDGTTACILPDKIHLSHSDGTVVWANPEAIADYERRPQKRDTTGGKYRKAGGTPKPEAATIKRIRDMSDRTTPETHVNPLADGPR